MPTATIFHFSLFTFHFKGPEAGVPANLLNAEFLIRRINSPPCCYFSTRGGDPKLNFFESNSTNSPPNTFFTTSF
jgi:hypothetical protein